MTTIRNAIATMTERNLGLGFGEDNQFIISLNEPNKALINDLPFSEEVMAELRQALQEKINHATTMKKTKQKIDKVTFVDVLTPILKKHYREEDVSNILSTTLALLIPDVLVDMNITRLTKHVIPTAMKDSQFKEMMATGLNNFFKFDQQGNVDFFIGEDKNNKSNYKRHAEFKNDDKNEESQVSLRFLRSIIVSKYMKDYGVPPEVKTKEEITEWKNKVLREQLAVIFKDLTGKSPPGIDLTKIDPKINLSDSQVYAYLVPAIIDRMNNDDLKKSSALIAKHLAITDFKPIAFEKYFQPHIKMSAEKISLTNENRRSLQLFAKSNKSGSANSTLLLRDKEYKFQHTHIHFEKDGEEKEYDIKDTNGKLIKFDGEVHNVFEYILPKEEGSAAPRKRLVAVGSPLQVIDTPNQDIKEVLDAVKKSEQEWQKATLQWEEDVKRWENRENKNDNTKKPAKPILNLEKTIDFGKVFMNELNKQSEKNELIYHSWASLRSGTHGFQSGLRFVISTQPVKVSQDQYNDLKRIFGQMRTNLQEEEILDPVDRKAGWRKERTTLTNELTHLMQKTSTLRAH